MEKAFRLSKDSEMFKDYMKLIENVKFQKKCVFDFFKEHEIEASKYYLTGDGFCNRPFRESWKEDISLGIVPTKKDKEHFGNMLLKPLDNGIYMFRKRCKLIKLFQDYAIEKQFVINIYQPDMRDYFKSLGFYGYGLSRLISKDNLIYIKISSDHLKDDDIPEGLEEIKISEFYAIRESEVEQ